MDNPTPRPGDHDLSIDAAAIGLHDAPPSRSLVQRLARGVRSGLRRYPREIVGSIGLTRPGTRLALSSSADPRTQQSCASALMNLAGLAEVADIATQSTAYTTDTPRSDMAAVWIGHATVLIRVGERTILTDPVFSERIGVTLPMPGMLPHALSGVLAPSPRRGLTLGLSRFAPPSLSIEQLPRIDVVLLSHAHFDHLDRPSLERLAAGPASGATVVTAGNTSRLVPRAPAYRQCGGFARVLELGWGQTLDVDGLNIEALRPAHWGARTAFDHHRKWNAYLVTGPKRSTQRFFFAGDTAFTSAFDRVDGVTLAAFGIGAYDPWHDAHATPEQAWRMFRAMRAARLLPMHHSTFPLSDEPIDEPLARLRRVASRDCTRLVCQSAGEIWHA